MVERKALWLHCPKCDTAWEALKLPMGCTLFSRLAKKCFCPKCGNTKKLTLASAAQIVAAEASTK